MHTSLLQNVNCYGVFVSSNAYVSDLYKSHRNSGGLCHLMGDDPVYSHAQADKDSTEIAKFKFAQKNATMTAK